MLKIPIMFKIWLMFWGGDSDSLPVFILQKRVMQIMYGIDTGNSCRYLFKGCEILTLTSVYIFEVMCCIKKYKFSMQQNVNIFDYNTREKMEYYCIFQCNTNIFKKARSTQEFDHIIRFLLV